ncbi:toprim domain-containing protein [Phorcysia thermohydrogeniphila]|uniref:5S rRNA maturation endonuclease (Ribonuclease M5) n=1 Tax=Phorcysia thermohydrogeniphila TaxID=936138 RepID=A0A4R1GPW5_9BACT|nr:toprim domain-containing protein [Phorcysia thermohydrogeniphila]TCK06542.1 5S rRNA maturation endonuclease (ribonuclease M5) [Phorcysia thermohydrogeniphila]
MEKLKVYISELKQFSLKNPDWVILVEGKRDLKALEMFGIENVVDMKGRKYHDIAEELSESYVGVVLLMDFDPEGETIFRKLTKVLELYGLKIDTSFRERLRELGVRFVEEIPLLLRLPRW